jgi:nitroreductase
MKLRRFWRRSKRKLAMARGNLRSRAEMNTRTTPAALLILMILASASFSPCLAEDLNPIRLPAPQTQTGVPLLQALKQRRTTRELKPGELPPQVLANLLWSGFGINRPDSGQRTAPSAMNSQEVDIYVALAEGLYVYDAKASRLNGMLPGDFRSRASGQAFAKNAAAVLIYVADLPRLTKAKPDQRAFYAAFDAGCISQNVYLYCASEGLATVVFDLDRAPLAAAMKLKPDQKIILAQAVGFPALPGSSH